MHYPSEYQAPIGAKRGITLAGQRLKPGYEVVLATQTVTRDGVSSSVDLTVANIGGGYFVRSCSVTKDCWLETFLFCPDKLVFGRTY